MNQLVKHLKVLLSDKDPLLVYIRSLILKLLQKVEEFLQLLWFRIYWTTVEASLHVLMWLERNLTGFIEGSYENES